MLCYHCMREKGDARFCPYCGAENLPDNEIHHLPAGTVIGGRYILGCVLGEGGFGITYIGYDRLLSVPVAVKEYFPYGFTRRDHSVSKTVSLSSSKHQDIFEKGKARFLSEAKTVARFRDEPGIVDVNDFVEENNTTYIIMGYLDGIDLRNYLRQYGALSVGQTLELMAPVIRSLEKVHEAGVIHRDISPDNLMVLKDGSIKLMDFGAARDFAGDERSMSVMLKKGYAPIEQYHRNGRQGPWTDVYALCATVYRCITGKTPDESLDRLMQDELKKPSELGVAIDPETERVLMYGLAVQQKDRCQSMTELMRLLEQARRRAPAPAPRPAARPVGAPKQPAAPASSSPDVTMPADEPLIRESRAADPIPEPAQKMGKTGFVIFGSAIALIVILVMIIAAAIWKENNSKSSSAPDTQDDSDYSAFDSAEDHTVTLTVPARYDDEFATNYADSTYDDGNGNHVYTMDTGSYEVFKTAHSNDISAKISTEIAARHEEAYGSFVYISDDQSAVIIGLSAEEYDESVASAESAVAAEYGLMYFLCLKDPVDTIQVIYCNGMNQSEIYGTFGYTAQDQ